MEMNGIKPVSGYVDPATMGENPNLEPAPIGPQPNPMEKEAAKQAEAAKDSLQEKEKLQDALDKVNKTAVIFDRSLRFQIHDKMHEAMVAVVDMKTDKVIREIPSKEVLDFVSKMQDYLGLIFDKKA